MTKQQINNVTKVLNASILMQVALEQLECIEVGHTPFVRENKKRLSNTIAWLNQENEIFTNSMAKEELELFSSVTDKIRQIVSEFKLEV
jgi:hypothetical protein